MILVSISSQQWQQLKDVRLAALRESPLAFGSAYEDECQRTDAQWRAWAERFDGLTAAGWLALEDGVGCGLVRGSVDDADQEIAWLESMWVAPAHRRQGVGQRLAEAVVAWARERAMRQLKLEVTSGNGPAIAFYRQLGFETTGHTRRHPRVASLAEIEMALNL